MLKGEEICRLIPHAGDMCLLEEVIAWDDDSVVCHTRSHRNKNHPLREHGRLAAIHAAEYGAQALAVHCGLIATRDGESVRPGYLVSLRDLKLHVTSLDTIESVVAVTAIRLMADTGNFIYEFQLQEGDRPVAEGKAFVKAALEQQA
jgi:predicted hotdog family 3-hydroxylacyl-ACP dehydratase